jgi:hypothetical protein
MSSANGLLRVDASILLRNPVLDSPLPKTVVSYHDDHRHHVR